MISYFQANVTVVLGLALALLIVGMRAASRDKQLRQDLSGALYLLYAFLALRALTWALSQEVSPSVAKTLEVSWMLAFSFGVIRTAVGIGLWGVRFRTSAPTPRILRDVIDFVLYGLVAFPVLKSQLDVDLTGVLATSAIVSVVLGFALQDTLGNLFAGLSIQMDRPFRVGDYVTVREHTGRVMQIAWRATRIETLRGETVTLPNSILSKEAVKNFSRGYLPIGFDLYFGASYRSPPTLVKNTVLSMLKEIPGLLASPTPKCRAWAYDDSSVRYQIRYYVASFPDGDDVMNEIYSRLWYRFHREGIEIPFPQRTLHIHSELTTPPLSDGAVRELLASVDLFAALPGEEHERLFREVVPRRFGRGERILEEGRPGRMFYLVASGEVSVRVGKPEVEVARLSRGEYFGEMSLLTDDARAATVSAADDAILLELDRPTFARLFDSYPNLANQLSAVWAERKAKLRALMEPQTQSPDPTPEAKRILGRLRQIFRLKSD